MLGHKRGVPLVSLGFGPSPGPLGLQPCCAWDQDNTQPGGTAKPLLLFLFILKLALYLERPVLASSQWTGLTPSSYTLS